VREVVSVKAAWDVSAAFTCTPSDDLRVVLPNMGTPTKKREMSAEMNIVLRRNLLIFLGIIYSLKTSDRIRVVHDGVNLLWGQTHRAWNGAVKNTNLPPYFFNEDLQTRNMRLEKVNLSQPVSGIRACLLMSVGLGGLRTKWSSVTLTSAVVASLQACCVGVLVLGNDRE
jgi:hypothetical protein